MHERGRGHRLALPERAVHRPLPRARTARAPSGSAPSSSPRSPAPTGAATRAGRCSPASTARPSSSKADLEEHLRAARGGPRARPPQARPRARPLHALRRGARACRSGCPRAPTSGTSSRSSVADEQRGPRLHRGAHADPLRRRALEEVRPLARVPRQHVLHGRRGPADGPEADELPGPRADLQARGAVLPRPADPLRRAGPRAPPRAERHAPRPAARAPHHPGRRPRVLHRGADRGRGAALPRLRLLHLRPVRLRAAARAVHASREARGHRGDVGQGRGRAPGRAREPRARVRAERGRRRVLRAEDRPPHDRHDRALVAAGHRPARLLHARAVRARLHGRGQRRAPAGDDPPGARWARSSASSAS